MHLNKIDRWEQGFSLIELLIVIIIISIVYFLGFSGIQKTEEKPKALTPLNLKSSIQKSELFQGEATLLCINDCKTCYLRKDVTEPFEAYESDVDINNIEAYTLDKEDTLLKLDYGRYQDQKICLQVHFYPNGSSTQIILKQDEDIYFLPAFFGEAQKIDSLNTAKTLWLENSHLIVNSGDFY